MRKKRWTSKEPHRITNSKYFGPNDAFDGITGNDPRFCNTEEESMKSFDNMKKAHGKEKGMFGINKR